MTLEELLEGILDELAGRSLPYDILLAEYGELLAAAIALANTGTTPDDRQAAHDIVRLHAMTVSVY